MSDEGGRPRRGGKDDRYLALMIPRALIKPTAPSPRNGIGNRWPGNVLRFLADSRTLPANLLFSLFLSLSPPVDKVARFKVIGDKTKIKGRFVFEVEIGYCRLRFDYSITFFVKLSVKY